jgi:hypothetical protein
MVKTERICEFRLGLLIVTSNLVGGLAGMSLKICLVYPKSYVSWRNYTDLKPEKHLNRPQIRTKISAIPRGPAKPAGIL